MIASAFGKVGFPILPTVVRSAQNGAEPPSFFNRFFSRSVRASPSPIFRRAHPTLITPRDFDLSPYFEVVKFNVIEPSRFDYRTIIWAEDEENQATTASTPRP